jgi:hypothetical protein
MNTYKEINSVKKVYISKPGKPDPNWINNYKVTLDNGEDFFVPHASDNRHYQMIQEWVTEGNVIEEQK